MSKDYKFPKPFVCGFPMLYGNPQLDKIENEIIFKMIKRILAGDSMEQIKADFFKRKPANT